MLRRAALFLIVIACACSGVKPDPSKDRFAPGDMLIASDADGGKTSMYCDNEPGRAKGETAFYFLNPGTSAQCQADEAEANVNDKGHDIRSVFVVVMDGEHKGKAGRVNRMNLRFVPR